MERILLMVIFFILFFLFDITTELQCITKLRCIVRKYIQFVSYIISYKCNYLVIVFHHGLQI